MKKLLPHIFALTLLPALFCASGAWAKLGSTTPLFDRIVSSKEYKKSVSDARKLGHGFGCQSVVEQVKSADYSRLPGIKNVFELVVLSCSDNPQDGGDSIYSAGLAVVSNGKVLSFTATDVGQSD